MAVDKRIWAKIDLGYLTNPKMADVLDTSGNAVLMHLASILHCAQHLTDGEVSAKAMQRITGGSAEDSALLIEAGLWHEPGHECEECSQPGSGKVYVHNYLEHNVSSNSVNKASEDGKKAAKARWEKQKKKDADRMHDASESHADRMHDPLPNAMLDREIDREIDKPSSAAIATIEEKGFPDHAHQLSDYLHTRMIENGVKAKAKIPDSWLDAADKLVRIDGYTPQQVAYVIDWSQRDSFWKSNILSMPKLREKFEQLKIKASTGHASSKPTTTTRMQETLTLGQELLAEEQERERRAS